MATRRGTLGKSGKSKRLTAAGFTGEARNMRRASRGGGSRFPTLYAGVFGRIVPVLETLSFLDFYHPDKTAKYDPDRGRSIFDRSQRLWDCVG